MGEYFLVVGLGQTGLSIARFLTRHQQRFMVFDTRTSLANINELKDEFNGIDIVLADENAINWRLIHTVVASPGVSFDEAVMCEAKKHHVDIIGDIELFARHNKKPVIAITGTNGKSTVTMMVGDIISNSGQKTAVCGNIGQPVLDVCDKEYDVFVMELSSFQLDLTQSLAPSVACILNISPDHIDRHKTLASYIAAKQRIFDNAKNIIANDDDKNTWPLDKSQQILSFGTSPDADFSLQKVKGTSQLFVKGKPFLDVSLLKIVGEHNELNALAASAMAFSFGVPLASISRSLQAFTGLAHRCQWVKDADGVRWINDSKGTNIGATVAALRGLGNEKAKNIIWIAGGQGKGADFNELAPDVACYVRHSILFGEDKESIKKALGPDADVSLVNNLQAAVDEAQQVVLKGDTVLFSPACASFDMFDNFMQRGDVFMKMILKQ